MVGMRASRLMGTTRGKSKVNGSCPRKEIKSPMGQQDKNDSQQAHMHNKR